MNKVSGRMTEEGEMRRKVMGTKTVLSWSAGVAVLPLSLFKCMQMKFHVSKCVYICVSVNERDRERKDICVSV